MSAIKKLVDLIKDSSEGERENGKLFIKKMRMMNNVILPSCWIGRTRLMSYVPSISRDAFTN
ncbi:hypothetical protein A9E81_05030 [Legionella pneumophila]|nr:hypothetical protein A9E97_05025 [Legionella pneumophila]PNL78618.1 hypothetical protein A6J41_011930 [Legionella pneumophila subsp. pneumophila]AOU07049.1 hypothetical protein A9E98_05030 [Legionella pneumophila]AOU10052.1 hypothetical protein A9F03_05215 [Legionella pneumophila]AOU12977.1 hypothetical protein A9E99_05035 [Legionella pneumophila]